MRDVIVPIVNRNLVTTDRMRQTENHVTHCVLQLLVGLLSIRSCYSCCSIQGPFNSLIPEVYERILGRKIMLIAIRVQQNIPSVRYTSSMQITTAGFVIQKTFRDESTMKRHDVIH
jgi:hypothetical protein